MAKTFRPLTLPLKGSRTTLSSGELLTGGENGLINLSGCFVLAASTAMPLTLTFPSKISFGLDCSGMMACGWTFLESSLVSGSERPVAGLLVDCADAAGALVCERTVTIERAR